MQPNQCPQCGATLLKPEKTKTGKKLQRCSTGSWNPQTQQTEGCTFVRWINDNEKLLKQSCPKCNQSLIQKKTKTGKKMIVCSTSGWDPENMVATGCDYVEWLDNKVKKLNENCPQCDSPLVQLTINGKKLKKCATAGWDKEFRQPTGCSYVKWER